MAAACISRGEFFPCFLELSTGPFSLLAGQRNPARAPVELDDTVTCELRHPKKLGEAALSTHLGGCRRADRFCAPEEADLADLHALLERRRQWRVSGVW